MPCWPRGHAWPSPSSCSRLTPRANSRPSPPDASDRPSIFQRLWQQTGCQRVIEQLLDGRRFEFDVERAIFLTVLHRLFAPGSDRAADKWRTDYQIDGCDALQLHHLYRAMAWLGEELPHDQQKDKTPFAPRCIKDRIEEELFAHRRDLFTDLQLVFFDTTSIYFEGDGGQDIGQRGYSKDHRPDLYQMVVGAVLDGQGRPICCELWPGNTADVTTLIPVVDRLRSRFGVRRVCIVADRGMISQETIEALEQDGAGLAVHPRGPDAVAERGEGRGPLPGRSLPGRASATGQERRPLALEGQGGVGGRAPVRRLPQRGRGPQGRRRPGGDRGGPAGATPLRETSRWSATRATAVTSAAVTPRHFRIDEAKIAEDARYDGKWVLRTNTESGLGRGGVAVQAALDGGALVPLVQVAVADPSDLPPV